VSAYRLFLLLGAINLALAVALGAFGAHALKARLSAELLQVYHTGNFYHFVHALGLVAAGLTLGQLGDRIEPRAARQGWRGRGFGESAWLKWSGGLMLAGILLFSGSLYLLSALGLRALGIVTPFGGAMFIAAWVALAVGAWKAT
jgi:uncharacterized membrane protein YgdD (TMEM256/DUF423 family)